MRVWLGDPSILTSTELAPVGKVEVTRYGGLLSQPVILPLTKLALAFGSGLPQDASPLWREEPLAYHTLGVGG
jgi:hypothetical protein